MAGEINVARYDNNEVLHRDDLQYGETREYENLTSLVERLAVSTNDPVIEGGIVKQRSTPSMNVDIEAVLAFCVSTGKIAYYGSDFGPVAITNGGAQNRIDTLEIRVKETSFDELQRAYKDPNTGAITYQSWMTKTRYEIEAQVIQGTESAGVAPNHTAGWIKIAEIDVDAGESTSILDADIHNVTAGYDAEVNSGWTAETAITFRSKALTEIKEILRVKHSEAGDHNNDVIRDQHIDFGAGAGQVDADLMPLGTNITHVPTGGTAAGLTSASTVRQAVQKILDLLIDLSGVQNDAIDSRHYAPDSIDDEHINFGTGAGQVSAGDLPIADAGGRITATEIEGALQELAGAGRTTETLKGNADDLDTHEALENNPHSVIASQVNIADAGGRITATEVENALQELAGAGRTTETLKGNADDIVQNADEIASHRTIHSVSGANYTVLDGDGYAIILVTAGASNRTINLPTAAANANRQLRIVKIDSGVGKVIVDGEGAEPINGTLTFEITEERGHLTIVCDGTGWHILSAEGSIVQVTLTSNDVQNNPAQMQWYNPNGRSITLPAGVWDIWYSANICAQDSALIGVDCEIALSTSASSVSDEELHGRIAVSQASAGSISIRGRIVRSKRVVLTTSTTFYIIIRASAADVDTIYIDSGSSSGYAVLRGTRMA